MTPIELLQNLIRTPSYSGEEQRVQDFIESYFSENNIESFRQGGNLVIHMKGLDQTRAFIFNSHVDVVDVGDETRWSYGGPWSGEVYDGKIYGRGASDMKSGVAASMETARLLSEQLEKQELPCDVWFVYVEKEEIDGSGTQSFANWFEQQGYLEQYQNFSVLFTEPTDMTSAEYGHRGNFFIRAVIDGEAGHASRPHKINPHAIVEMAGFIDDLEEESLEWQRRFGGFEFAPPTITPTSIEAKSGSPNKVSDHAEATFDLRTVPGFHQEAFDRVKKLAEKRGIKLSLLYPDAPTGYTNKNAKIIQKLQTLVSDLKLEVSQGSADLGFMTQIGAEGVIFGPGEKDQAHRIDEHAPIDHLQKAIEIYLKLYFAWAS